MSMKRTDVLDFLKDCKIEDDFSSDNYEKYVLQYLPYDCNYDYGVSKLVLLPENTNFVIKIPFCGSLEEEEVGTDEDGYCEYQDYFCENENATMDDDYYWDYCLAETLAYRSAKAHHVEQAFCKTSFVGFVRNHPIYIQERAKTCSSRYSYDFYYDAARTEKARKSAASNGFLSMIGSSVWQTDLFEYYGEKQYLKILNFIKEYDIKDLHRENVGYVGRRPVLLDYSSWSQ